MAELFFDDERMGIQDSLYNNQLQNESFSDLRYQDMGGVHSPLSFPTYTGGLNYNIHQDPDEDWRANNAINYSPTYPQPFTPPNMREISGEIGEYGRRPGWGNEEMFYEAPKKGFQFPSILTALANKLKREPNPVLDAELAALDRNKGYLDTGEFVQKWGDKESIYDFIKTPQGTETIRVLADKNAPGKSGWGSETYEEQLDKKEAWVAKRLLAGKRVGADILKWYQNRTGTSDRFDDGRLIKPDQPITVGDNVNQGGANTYTGPKTYDFMPQHAQPPRPDLPGGFLNPGPDSYGPHKRAEGGRIGYANGEFVDEDVNIQGPGYDVNENIEMASAQDPMDALNDMAMQIFGKQLHELTPEEKQILFDMANDQAAGQGEGIASLV